MHNDSNEQLKKPLQLSITVAASVHSSVYPTAVLADSSQCLVANVRAFVARSRRGLVLGHNLSSLSDDVEVVVASSSSD